MRERLEYLRAFRTGPMAMAFSGDFSLLDSAFGPAVVVHLAGRSWLGLALRGPFLVCPWIRAAAFQGGPKKVRDAQGTLAIDICLKFLMEVLSPHEVGRRQDAGLVWLDPSWLGLESTSGLTVLARAGVIRSCTGN